MSIYISVPDGVSGDWSVETFEVDPMGSALSHIQAKHGLMGVTPGQYKRLKRNSTVVMSNTPMEIRTNSWIIHCGEGDILINGLGLGMVVSALLAKDTVTSITVIEKSADVIKLVAPTYQNDPRFNVIQADAFEYQPPKGIRYDYVWHDIWDDICADNLPQMHKLHRKYGRRCDHQGSWSREVCEEIMKRDKKMMARW